MVRPRSDSWCRPCRGIGAGAPEELRLNLGPQRLHVDDERSHLVGSQRLFPRRHPQRAAVVDRVVKDRKSTRLNSSHGYISYAVFCLKKKKQKSMHTSQYL